MIVKGSVVKSSAGHDSGSFYVVLETDGTFAWIADGRVRKVQKPKKKNHRHLKPANTVLDVQDLQTNKLLKKALSVFNQDL